MAIIGKCCVHRWLASIRRLTYSHPSRTWISINTASKRPVLLLLSSLFHCLPPSSAVITSTPACCSNSIAICRLIALSSLILVILVNGHIAVPLGKFPEQFSCCDVYQAQVRYRQHGRVTGFNKAMTACFFCVCAYFTGTKCCNHD